LSFDPEKLVSVGRLYNLETRIQTKIANGVGGEGSGEEAQTCQPGKDQPGKGGVGDVGSSGGTTGLSAHLGKEKNE
jgi:hypothetical protein